MGPWALSFLWGEGEIGRPRCGASGEGHQRGLILTRGGHATRSQDTGGPYSGSIFASFTIFAHFAVSATTNDRSSSGDLATGSMPAASSLDDTSLSASASRNAALSRSTMAFGVFAGANAANQAVRS